MARSAAVTRHRQQQKYWSGRYCLHTQLVGLGPRTQLHVSHLRLFPRALSWVGNAAWEFKSLQDTNPLRML